VIAPSAIQADAWATALLVLGAEEGRELAGKAGLEALFLKASPKKVD
jgi:thiamine biosynthesis lipoprotein